MSSFVGFNKGPENDKENSFRITSHNLQSINPIKKKNGTIIPEAKSGFISQMKAQGNPTIFCSQETSSQGLLLLKETYDYTHSFKGSSYGTVIFSDLKFISTGELDLRSDEASSAIWADIHLGRDTIRVYNVHLRSNKISSSASKMLKEADLQSSKTWNSVRGILANYKNSTIVRTQQAKIIMDHAEASPYKTIICGDLNDTPLSHVYKILKHDKKDSFNEHGIGIGTTYAGVIPALRIDYILTDHRLDIIDHQIHKGNYSDHYPISAQIVLP